MGAAQLVFESPDMLRVIASFMCVGSRCSHLVLVGWKITSAWVCGGGWTLLCVAKLNRDARASLIRTAFAPSPPKELVVRASRRNGRGKTYVMAQLLLHNST